MLHVDYEIVAVWRLSFRAEMMENLISFAVVKEGTNFLFMLRSILKTLSGKEI